MSKNEEKISDLCWQTFRDVENKYNTTPGIDAGMASNRDKHARHDGIFGFTNTANMFGIVHQSNGRGGVPSRSWNRIYANFLVEQGNLALSFKPCYGIQEDGAEDEITGHFTV